VTRCQSQSQSRNPPEPWGADGVLGQEDRRLASPRGRQECHRAPADVAFPRSISGVPAFLQLQRLPIRCGSVVQCTETARTHRDLKIEQFVGADCDDDWSQETQNLVRHSCRLARCLARRQGQHRHRSGLETRKVANWTESGREERRLDAS
jgi:hypothetical protein